MRKRLITPATSTASQNQPDWLDLEALAQVEISSENPNRPIEDALSAGGTTGWQAADSGEQIIRFLFDVPQKITRIRLCFREVEVERSQEFVLRWFSGSQWQEIVRQHYHFSPPGTTEEIEDYQVDLSGVTSLALVIVPDKGKGSALASLARFQMA